MKTLFLAFSLTMLTAVSFSSERPARASSPNPVPSPANTAETARPDSGFADAGPLAVPPVLLASTFRLKAGATEQGTAFGVNLSEFGRERPRFLLAAARCVKSKHSQIVMAELRDARGRRWVNCKVLAADKGLDLCLLEAEEDLPGVASLSKGETLPAGTGLILIACPAAAAPGPFGGRLTDAPLQGQDFRQMAVPFSSGCSGGPVYAGGRLEVAGTAVSGVSNGQDGVLPDAALFLPAARIRSFLTAQLGPSKSARISVAAASGEAAPTSGPVPVSEARTRSSVAAAAASAPGTSAPSISAPSSSSRMKESAATAVKSPPSAPAAKGAAKIAAGTPDPKDGRIHVLERGESLSSVAKKYNVKLMVLQSVNRFKDPNNLYVGTKILIPNDPAKLSTLSSTARRAP